MLARMLGGPNMISQIVLYWQLLHVAALSRKSNIRIVLPRSGKTLSFAIRDAIDIAALLEAFVMHEYKLNEPGSVHRILDIGAHIGAASAFFADEFPDATIDAYEPDPQNFELLQKNMKALRVMCHPEAVAASAGEVEFFVHTSSMSSSLISRPGSVSLTIRSVALDSIISNAVDIVKFDIEGAEYMTFAGSKKLSEPRQYIGEVHYDLFSEDRETFRRLFSSYECDEALRSPQRSIFHAYRSVREDSRHSPNERRYHA
jgi:FkbM family methyltransferase